MDLPEIKLQSLSASRILDVATGRGNFLLTLCQNLNCYESAIGIDFKPYDEWHSDQYKSHSIQFIQMDAARLQFDENSFDLVSISNSLHHLPEPGKVLAEMIRVLKPAGWFVFREMIADDANPPQITHTLLHRWWGEIDRAAGIYHHAPYSKRQLVKFLRQTAIEGWEFHEEADLSEDPFEQENLKELNQIIQDYQNRTRDDVLIAKGEKLKNRIQEVGFLSATELWAFGRKTD